MKGVLEVRQRENFQRIAEVVARAVSTSKKRACLEERGSNRWGNFKSLSKGEGKSFNRGNRFTKGRLQGGGGKGGGLVLYAGKV